MSKYLLKIGYAHFLLPDDRGLPALMKVLGRALVCSDLTYTEPSKIVTDGLCDLRFERVPARTQIVPRNKKGAESTPEFPDLAS